MVGRESGEIRLEVVDSANANELGEFVDVSCLSGTTVNTDEWSGYNRVGGRHDRIHVTVDHSGPRSSWAIDADGDGVREVHCKTMEGTWTGLRNFLRPFRGVSKWYMSQYVAIDQRQLEFPAVLPRQKMLPRADPAAGAPNGPFSPFDTAGEPAGLSA